MISLNFKSFIYMIIIMFIIKVIIINKQPIIEVKFNYFKCKIIMVKLSYFIILTKVNTINITTKIMSNLIKVNITIVHFIQVKEIIAIIHNKLIIKVIINIQVAIINIITDHIQLIMLIIIKVIVINYGYLKKYDLLWYLNLVRKVIN